jgi:hypothetical protein
MSAPSTAAARVILNPRRNDVLSIYRKMLKAAFDVNWSTDDDAVYVLEETRRLFHRNAAITNSDIIDTKLREAEARYALAVHYRIPYPRPFYKATGSMNDSGVAYSVYLDSSYDQAPINPHVGNITEGVTGVQTMTSVPRAATPGDDPLSYEHEIGDRERPM